MYQVLKDDENRCRLIDDKINENETTIKKL